MLGLEVPFPGASSSHPSTRLPPPPSPPLPPSPDVAHFGLDASASSILAAAFFVEGSLTFGAPIGLTGGWRRSRGFAAHADHCCCCLRGVVVAVPCTGLDLDVLATVFVPEVEPPVPKGFLEKGATGSFFRGARPRRRAMMLVGPVELDVW